jgi:hypothetical protein
LHLQSICDTKSKRRTKGAPTTVHRRLSTSDPLRGFGATAAAALLVFFQLTAVAHFHNPSSQSQTARAEAGAGGDRCAVCLATLHAPAASSPVRDATAPALKAAPVRHDDPVRVTRSASDEHFGRAPPASL